VYNELVLKATGQRREHMKKLVTSKKSKLYTFQAVMSVIAGVLLIIAGAIAEVNQAIIIALGIASIIIGVVFFKRSRQIKKDEVE
jgi:ABC-type uncharacterized transport system permease subunit